ncbi:MAG: S1C family serine protease [Bacilli bacterium]
MSDVGKKPIKIEKNVESKKPIKVKKENSILKFNNTQTKKVFVIISLMVIILLISIFIPKLFIPSIEKVKDSVVLIEVYDDNNEIIATGSGFSAYENDWIVTNFHVIEGASSILVITDEKEEYEVNDIVIFNKKEDLAIVKIDGSLNNLKLGNGNKVKTKDKVTAIGSPMGEQNTVSEGIVSNSDEKDIIRTTAPISHGSSGGVLLNNKNEVIGITSAGYDEAQNLNFAINVNVLKDMYSAYKNNKYDVITNSNYKDCAPNIINYNTDNKLSIKNKCSFSSYNNYSADSLDSFYLATNSYEIFDTAMYKLGINGFNINYKNLSKSKQKEAAENYAYLLQYETCSDDEVVVCELKENIASWTMEQFIMELDLLKTYELAILMVEIDNYLYSTDGLVNYLNDTNLDYEDKIILNRLFNKNDNRYNKEIIEVFDNDDRITYDQEVELLEYLGMTVDSNGNVYW